MCLNSWAFLSETSMYWIVSLAAVFSLVTQRSSCAFFRHFGDFQAGILAQISFNLFKKDVCNMTARLSPTSIAFYDILAQACVEIKILRPENKVTYVFPG